MAEVDPEVERLAELCWRAFNPHLTDHQQWPNDSLTPYHWRQAARAVLADRAAHPPVPVTDGPTLLEVARERAERDEALARVDVAMRLVAATRAERDGARDRAEAAEAERDALRNLLTDAETERDGARAMVERLDTSENAQRNQRHVAERERDALRARLDALSCWVPSDDTLNLMREAIPGDKSIMRAHWRAAAIVVRDALLTAKEHGEEGRAGVTIPPVPTAAAADQRAPTPAPTPEIPTFEGALAAAVNRFSEENASNTPDWILAQFLLNVLSAWNTGVQQRETWYGRDPRPAAPVTASDLPTAPSCTRCMDLRVVQILGGSVEPCPSCGPACPHGKRAGDPPCLACAATLADAESVLASIAKGTHFIIRRDEARVLLTELARLRAAKESR